MNPFNAFENLEPKCPKCNIKIVYGVNTEFRDDVMAMICSACNQIL